MVAKTCLTIACALTLMGSAAQAQDTATVGAISDLNAQALRVTAEAAVATAQLQKAQTEAKLKAIDGTPVGQGAVIPGASGGAASPLPVVKGVFGADGRLFATFLFADGTSTDAKVGDRLPGGFKVVSIDPGQVAVMRGGQHFDIGFSASAPVVKSDTPSSQQPGVPMPFVPPMVPGGAL